MPIVTTALSVALLAMVGGSVTPSAAGGTLARHGTLAAESVAGPVRLAQAGPSDLESVYWEGAKDSTDPAVLQSYIDRFPNGFFAGEAKAKLASLRDPPPAPAVAVVPSSSGPEAVPLPSSPTAAAVPPPAGAAAVPPPPRSGAADFVRRSRAHHARHATRKKMEERSGSRFDPRRWFARPRPASHTAQRSTPAPRQTRPQPDDVGGVIIREERGNGGGGGGW